MSESAYQTPKSSQVQWNSLEPLGKEFKKIGKQFRIKHPGKLPSVCVACGKESELIKVQEKLRYVNPLVIFWIFLSPLVLIIAYFICRRSVSIEFERCQGCQKKSSLWSKMALVGWFGLIVSVILRWHYDSSMGIFLVASILVFLLFALFCSAMKDPGFSVQSYHEPHFYLKGFKKDVAIKMSRG